MAEIVQGLFGVSPDIFRKQQDAQFRAQALAEAQLNPEQQNYYQMANMGRQAGRAIGSLFGAEDPALARQSAENALLQQVQSSLSPADLQDPYKLSAAVYQAAMQANLPELANNAYQNMQAGKLANAKVGTEQAQAAQYNANAALKESELIQEQQASQALRTLYAAKQELGQTPTTEEIIATAAPYMSAEKLATMMQTSADKAAYRQTMLDQAKAALEGRIEAAKQRQADAKEIAQMRIDGQKELKQIAASLNPKNTSTSSVFERGYANNTTVSFAELVPATTNLNILTQGGTSPVTAGVFTNIKGTGILSSTSAALGTVITPAEQGQYESIMLPVIQNIGTIQNAGRRTTISQLDNLKNALIAKAGQPYIVQVQKMGELRQIAEAAAEAAMANSALNDDQKSLISSNIERVKQSIPFTGADVAKFSVYSKKNPNVAFKDWLKVNGTDRGAVAPAAGVLQEGMTGMSKSKKPMVVRNGKWEYQ
jgi:hypothetical protein